jgi:4-amino-4-deoxy-L-arabinose transferase-like glycosyltransferase
MQARCLHRIQRFQVMELIGMKRSRWIYSLEFGPPSILYPRMIARHTLLAGAILVAALIRIVGLDTFPLTHPDEGGWPLSVREWVETGKLSEDYYMAPGYHWLLGIPFRLFGPYHLVGRMVSVVVSLVTLVLFYRLTTRLACERVAFWATLLLGTSYPAVLIDRRALMEPFLLVLVTALCLTVWPFVATSPVPKIERWRFPVAALLTALLLLTKASGVFILPAIVFAVIWAVKQSPRASWKPGFMLTGCLACGTITASLVFYWLYSSDPAGFLQGWTEDAQAVNVPGATAGSTGRFSLSPLSIERTVRWFAEYEPVLFGLAILGLVKAIWLRQQPLFSAWFGFGAMLLFSQIYVQGNHRAILLPALAFFAAWLLTALFEAPIPRFSWPQAALVLLTMYSLTRVTAGIIQTTPPERSAALWLSARTGPTSRVMAAPYVLMRLQAEPISFWALNAPFVPTRDQMRIWKPDWLVVEDSEWRFHQQEASKGDSVALRDALSMCCDVAFEDSGTTVYKVKQTFRAGLF